MNEETAKDVITMGSYVIVKKQNYSKVHKITKNNSLKLGKDQIDMDEIIGKRFWTTFEMVPLKNGKTTFTLKVVSETESLDDLKSTLPSGPDNRSITDDGTSQKLTKEEILELQESGKSGKEIVGSLIENSKSFSAKTEYSQEKYIKKKERKYFRYLTVCKPTILLLQEIYFRQDYTKIGGLRMEGLAQVLTYSDVQADGLYILYDSGSQGMPAAAMLNRIGENTNGLVINLHPGNFPQMAIIQAMNFPKEQAERLTMVNIYSFLRLYHQGTSVVNNICKIDNQSSSSQVEMSVQETRNGNDLNLDTEKITVDQKLKSSDSTINCEPKSIADDGRIDEPSTENVNSLKRKSDGHAETSPPKKPKWLLETEHAVDLVKNSKARGLAIVAKEHPLNIVEALIPFLGTSRPFVIFHNHREPLQETYIALKQKQSVINLRLFTNFLRSYQVLTDRTHPDILTSDTGGYILTGYLVE